MKCMWIYNLAILYLWLSHNMLIVIVYYVRILQFLMGYNVGITQYFFQKAK